MRLYAKAMKKVYLGSRFTNWQKVVALRDKMLSVDPSLEFVMTWPEEAKNAKPLTDEMAYAIAMKDMRELESADTLLVLTEDCPAVPGGMHFEMGCAYAIGTRVIVVGPPVHVFCRLPHIERYANIQEFLAEFMESRGKN